ncbi:riboflavin kinase / FAD synthase family protein [Plasmodium cynomolgi strain B]|uniref:riboflavin kinase n=1 Tax=Plasmodium cynomolgi (strain B) TaxID=1120755 RepID=K6UUR7_PLACD|nr:riboflavin kinase / FAD synthase family protein [Plasmodium cynomolgi strain B]GAB67194.1 riboflavin kinase / FAD synthase family protein [Plasmodium cynomolgi strain B]
MRTNEGKKRIALIDADHYIINYRSTITTYVQNICNNLLKGNGESAKDANNEWDAKRRERIICVFMFSMYLNNIHRNLNLFSYLHDVLIKYNHLMGRSRTSQGRVEGGDDSKMYKLDHSEVNETPLGGGTSQQREGRQKQKEMEPPVEQCMGKEDERSSWQSPSRDGNRDEPGDITHFMHDLIKDKNYDNMDNVTESKVCFLNIKNKGKNTRGSPESLRDSFDAEGHTCATELSSNSKMGGTHLGHATKGSGTSDSDEEAVEDAEEDAEEEAEEDAMENVAENSVKSAAHPDGDGTSRWANRSTRAEAVDEASLEDPQDDSFHESQGSTYRFSNSSPVCQGQKQFLINYNSVNLKVKNFDSLLSVENFLVEQKKQTNIQYSSKEIENLYRIIVLSKLHIGLTQTLFRYFKISKHFKNCYKIIDSFEELKKNGNADKEVLIFSNRECFVSSAKREGYFKVAGGKKNPSMATNCDDVNWDVLTQKESLLSNTSDYISNKYNDVVYPFLRNCNLTEDILSWRIFYIFKKYMYIHGTVVKGFGRGSKYLKIPTANISYSNLTSTDIMPGIYFGISRLKKKIYKTVVSIGYNPFFENKHITIEAFLYYKTNTLFYDEDIHLIIVGILRSESNFSYFSHLIHAIQFDCEIARIILSKLQDDEQFVRCRDYLQSL